MITITRRYEMEVAHHLTAGVPENHKCRRLHGHRYVLEISIEGTLDADGILAEYGEIDSTVKPILRMVDHHDLNTLSERCSTAAARAVSENPTVERLVAWLTERLRLLESVRGGKHDQPEQVIKLMRVAVEEDSRSQASWRRP